MKTFTLRLIAAAAVLLAVVWVAAEAEDADGPHHHMMGDGGAMPGPHGDTMYFRAGGPMPGCAGAGGMMMEGGPMTMPMAGDPMHLVHLAELLDLSADQRKQVGAIMDATMPKLRDLMFRMADAHKALREYKEADKKDEAALRKITDEHGKVMSEMMFLTMKMHQDLRAVLTEDQVKKLDELKSHMGGHPMHGMRFFSRHPGGDGGDEET